VERTIRVLAARPRERLKLVLPVTIFIVFLLLYLNTRSVVKTLIVFLAVPFWAVGAIWLLHFLGYNMSIAVWVGLIALIGVDGNRRLHAPVSRYRLP